MEFNLEKFGFDGIYTQWWALCITLAVVVGLVALVIVAVSLTKKDGEPFRMQTRDLTYASVCVAVAFALSFFGLTMPQGGTITLVSTLPIMIYCYFFGFRKACIICTVYMLLQFFQNPYIISPWSALFDYVIPYMALIFVGAFGYKIPPKQDNVDNITQLKNPNPKAKGVQALQAHIRFFVGCGCYILVRYTSHVMSGVMFFSEYAWEGWAVLPYSLAYNSFVLIDFAIALAAAVCLLLSRSFNAFMQKNLAAQRPTKKTQAS